MLEFDITVPEGQIMTMCGVEDISYFMRQSAAMEKLADMRFEYV